MNSASQADARKISKVVLGRNMSSLFAKSCRKLPSWGFGAESFLNMPPFTAETALRIFYGLDRFSEDLDFTCLPPIPTGVGSHLGIRIKNELAAFGFEVSFVEKDKKRQTAIKSAFLKTPTVQELLKIGVHQDLLKGVHPEALIRIRVEIDTAPALRISLRATIFISTRCSIDQMRERRDSICLQNAYCSLSFLEGTRERARLVRYDLVYPEEDAFQFNSFFSVEWPR